MENIRREGKRDRIFLEVEFNGGEVRRKNDRKYVTSIQRR